MAKAKRKINYKHYFDINPSADKIYVTEDGQVFYESGKHALLSYARENKVKYKVITRAEALAMAKENEKTDETSDPEKEKTDKTPDAGTETSAEPENKAKKGKGNGGNKKNK